MADLTVQRLDADGHEITFIACDPLGDIFTNNGQTFLQITNTGETAEMVTVNSVKPCNYGFDHDMVFTVPAGKTITTPTFSPARFNDNQGKVSITYSDATNLQIAAVSII